MVVGNADLIMGRQGCALSKTTVSQKNIGLDPKITIFAPGEKLAQNYCILVWDRLYKRRRYYCGPGYLSAYLCHLAKACRPGRLGTISVHADHYLNGGF